MFFFQVRIDCRFKNKVTGKIVDERDLPRFPKKKYFSKSKVHRVVFVIYRVALDLIVNMVKETHLPATKKQLRRIDVSLDGVPESKSGNVSLDILSIRFPDLCRQVHTLAVSRPEKKTDRFEVNKPTLMKLLGPFLKDLGRAGMRVRLFIADAPQRCKLRGQKQFNGRYSCDYCFCPGSGIGASTVYDPALSQGHEERTHGKVVDIMHELKKNNWIVLEKNQKKKKNGMGLTAEEAKGK